MPRSIIDTESSRPAYVRRTSIRWAVVVAVLIAILVAVYFTHFHQAPQHAATRLLPTIQETSPLGAESGAFPHRRSHAA